VQQNVVFNNIISALVSLLLLSFLILSSKINHKYSIKNYKYLQFITAIFLLTVLAYGYFAHLNEIIWFSLIGISLFIILKYLEIFSFFSDWKRGKAWAWKLMGLAGLLWLLGKGILYVSKLVFVA